MALFGTGEQALSIVIRARDEASKVFNKVEGNLKGMDSKLRAAQGASASFAVGLGAAGLAAGGLGAAMLKAASDAEQTRIAFSTMLGSAEQADTFIRDLVQFAKTTPFELKGLEDSAKKLLAYGRTQEQVLPDLKMLGDISAGVGMDKLPQLILAFGQVSAATKLTGMELRQFSEAGVPLLGTLAEHFGVTAAEVQDMVSKGQVGFEDVRQALADLTGEGGRFEDLMSKQADTLGGKWSNLKDAFDIFLRNEGQKLIEWAKRLVEGLIVIVEDVLPPLIQKLDALFQWFSENRWAITIVAGAIIGALVPALYALIVAFAAGAIALAPWLIGGAIIGGLVTGIIWIVKNWDSMKAKALEVWIAIKTAFKDGANFLIGLAEGYANAWVNAVNTIIKALNTIKVSIPEWVPKLGGKSFGINIPLVPQVNLPRFEHGGIVPGAVGTAVPIMAHAGERIVPRNQAKGGGGDTDIVNVNNPVVRDRSDVRTLRNEIDRALRDVVRVHKVVT